MIDRNSPAEAQNHLQDIDTLRAIAICMTLFAHLAFVTRIANPHYVWFVSNIGQFWPGVDLFFVVSGFVVSRQLCPMIDRAKSKTGVLRYFYIRRAFRILPLAILWSILVLTVSWTWNISGVFGVPSETTKHFIASTLFFENIYLTFNLSPVLSIYWSLSLEEQFYLIYPIILIFLPTRFRVPAMIAGVCCMALLPRPVDQSKLISMIRYDGFLMGALVYCWTTHWTYAAARSWVRGHLWAGQILLFTCVVVIVLAPIQLRWLWCMMGFVDIVCTVIVALAVLDIGVTGGSIAWLGARSYGLYLAHMPVILVTKELGARLGFDLVPNTLFNWQLGCLIVVIFAVNEFLHSLLELPARRYGRSLSVSLALNSAAVREPQFVIE